MVRIKEDLKILKEKALGNCWPDEAFWVCNGTILKSLYELLDHISKADNWTFKYHVNDNNNKNDFAKWIRDVFKDSKLADELDDVKDKKKYVKILQKRIKQLESA
ncbi:MAG: hypothetical protein KJ674_00415 [Nanoarchaeota archaeon]|nr:hypothetical protein [Nanoarchaeota archaeon]